MVPEKMLGISPKILIELALGKVFSQGAFKRGRLIARVSYAAGSEAFAS